MMMQIGEAKETVEVTSEAPLVDTTSTQLGAIMDQRQVSTLPPQFPRHLPTVAATARRAGCWWLRPFYGSNQAGAVSVNGGRGRSNNFNVNGGDGNDLFVNAPAIQPTPDSIEEFRVLSNTFDAEYGRNSGAVINVVTKSGTNGWHGSVYEFLRNQAFNAKGYLDLRRPDDKQNQFWRHVRRTHQEGPHFFLHFLRRTPRRPWHFLGPGRGPDRSREGGGLLRHAL